MGACAAATYAAQVWPSAAENLSGSGERDPADRRRLGGQRRHILGLEVMDVRLAAGAREDLDLRASSRAAVGDALGGLVDLQALHQLRVLRRDADRAAAGVAVVAGVAARRPSAA